MADSVAGELSVEKLAAAVIRFRLPGLLPAARKECGKMRAFAALRKTFIVASSYSKNFGIMRARRRLHLVAADAETVDRAFGRVKSAIRVTLESPPAHGVHRPSE